MANEVAIINNPDSTPGAVSSGYQAQNTRMAAASAGMDASVVSGGDGACYVEISGPVDVNGVLYSCNAKATLTPPSAGNYYIYLSGSGSNLTPVIGTDPGTFDASKNARYTTGGYRVLNWRIYYDGTTCYVARWLQPDRDGGVDVDEPEEVWITSSGTWVAPRSKWYTIWITGRGGSGSLANYIRWDPDGVSYSSYAGSGGGGATGVKRIYIEKGTVCTLTFNTGPGALTQIVINGVIYSAQNGYNGGQGYSDDGDSYGARGAGGSSVSNCDAAFYGGDGSSGTADGAAIRGGASIYGGSAGSAGSLIGKQYGGGGTGGYRPAGTTVQNGGVGASGVIRIVG